MGIRLKSNFVQRKRGPSKLKKDYTVEKSVSKTLYLVKSETSEFLGF